ncbi:hypothetical protein AcW1_003798 [Taiwanofungus camphoratus]|nr:hypothetical protein AcV5_003519 [Antrodia cinnamomea]KAI0940662.1 hypothetical protein AcW1_003798 [Antrodia cinnamomea]KAI0958165.1 hypothetical protein AcV7_004055 [Antrodia cinnamomea]
MDVASQISNCAVSPRGMFRVFGYHPSEGPPGTNIAVSLNFTLKANETIFLRLVLGHKALTTGVHQLSDRRYGTWELQATVPLEPRESGAATVALAVQALNSQNEILDSVTFGRFTYLHPTNTHAVFDHETSADPPGLSVPLVRRAHSLNDSVHERAAHHFIPNQTLGTRTPSTRSREGQCAKPARSAKRPSFIRSVRAGSGDDIYDSPRALLELVTPLESMCKDWDEEELSVGRRLVRFTRVQDGFTLKVSCERIKQHEYVDGDTAVSCIYRADTDSCYVTSVDIIYLLERLVGLEFDIEEKNRIRRNLEGFRPKTVSKSRLDSNDFFLKIMNFPPPKPRNIEKDLKVFDWNILPQALDKIVSRYSLSSPVLDHPAVRLSSAPAQDVSPRPSSLASGSTPDIFPYAHTPAGRAPTESLSTSAYAYSTGYPGDAYGNTSVTSYPMTSPHQAHPMSFLSYRDTGDSYARSSATVSPCILATPSASHDVLYDPQDGMHQSIVPSEDHLLGHNSYGSQGTYGLDGDIATFDSIEFQTLREHKQASSHYSDQYKYM